MVQEYVNLNEKSQLYDLSKSHLLAIIEALGLEKPKDLEHESFGDLILKHVNKKVSTAMHGIILNHNEIWIQMLSFGHYILLQGV